MVTPIPPYIDRVFSRSFIAHCVENKRELELLPGPDQVQRLFEISGLVDDLPFASGEPPVNPDEG